LSRGRNRAAISGEWPKRKGQVGNGQALTKRKYRAAFDSNRNMFKASSLTPLTAPTIRKLAGLKPGTLAVMHGACFTGDLRH
jgi:hypothetical protein